MGACSRCEESMEPSGVQSISLAIADGRPIDGACAAAPCAWMPTPRPSYFYDSPWEQRRLASVYADVISCISSILGFVGNYIIQSGRAVMYPIYEETYERRINFFLPSASQAIELTTDWYKDAARSLDYLATRPDIDSGKLAYHGVSMGSAAGVTITTLLQDRLKTAIFLDGGYFLEKPPPGGDQADFAPRMKKPVLMVNGRYDFTFPLDKSQEPLFRMLGTSEEDKKHVVLETPHDVTEQRPQLVRAVLDWLDRYLGRVSE